MEQFHISVYISREGNSGDIKCQTQLDEDFLKLDLQKKLAIIKAAASPLPTFKIEGGEQTGKTFSGLVSIQVLISQQTAAMDMQLSESLQSLHQSELHKCMSCISEYLLRMGVSFLNVQKNKSVD